MIKINNWSSFQSYKDRKPPWIRFHKSLLDNFEYQCMSANARALLPMLWLLASEDEDPTSGLIRDNNAKIAFRLRLPRQEVDEGVAEIEAAGFIEQNQPCNESVTEPLRNGLESVTPETETETETETDKKLSSDNSVEQSAPTWREKIPPEIVPFAEQFQGYVAQTQGAKAPVVKDSLIKSCSEAVDKLIRIDKHSLDTIANVLRWAVTDEFWADNVLSLASLRKRREAGGQTKFQKILAAYERTSVTSADVLREMERRVTVGRRDEAEGIDNDPESLTPHCGVIPARHAGSEGNPGECTALARSGGAQTGRDVDRW
jgi:hypothetical protein